MSKFIRSPRSRVRGSLSRLSRGDGRQLCLLVQLLDPLADRRYGRVLRGELDEALVRGDRRLRVLRVLGRLRQGELDARVVRVRFRDVLVRGDSLGVGRRHLLVGIAELRGRLARDGTRERRVEALERSSEWRSSIM